MEETKSYALDNLKAWVEEAIDSDVTPDELYNTIRTTVIEKISYHEACLKHSKDLLTLLSNSKIYQLKKSRVGKDMDILS